LVPDQTPRATRRWLILKLFDNYGAEEGTLTPAF